MDGIRGAYGIALRITGSPHVAEEIVCAAAAHVGLRAADLVRATRLAARGRQGGHRAAPVPRPASLRAVAADDWAILERVALRGMLVTEAARDEGLERREALRRLRRGLVSAREALARAGEPGEHPEAARLDRLGANDAACRLDDAPCDRQPEAAARACVAI